MARILLCFYQNIIENDYRNLGLFYEQLSTEFATAGNDVLVLNMGNFRENWISDKVFHENELKTAVETFDPDIVIAFNNQVFPSLFNAVSCPIVIWTADTLPYFPHRDLIAEHLPRYRVVSTNRDTDDFRKAGFDAGQILHLKLATSLKRENLPQDKEISFIGTKFGLDQNLFKRNTPAALSKAYRCFLESHAYDYKTFFDDKTLLNEDVWNFFDLRNIVLTALTEFDLHLYGIGWDSLKDHLPQLYGCFEKKRVFSLRHNQDIYNSSKICLSVSHPQAQGKAYPWRIMDIMASNGCLVTQYSSQLKEETAGWVDLPMYHTPMEARDLCATLLRDESRRREIVKASQKYVEANARWPARIKQLGDFLNIPLINASRKGGVEIIPPVQTFSALQPLYLYLQSNQETTSYRLLRLLFRGAVCLIPKKELRHRLRKDFSLTKART